MLKRREWVMGAGLATLVAGCRKRRDDVNDSPVSMQPPPPPDPPPPEYVYVPAPGFRVVVTLDLPGEVRRGDAVRLHARRESLGEWLKVRSATLPADAIWYTAPWPAKELEVAANLGWQTDPPHAMTLDSGLKSAGLGMEREAVFRVAGLVAVWAISATPLHSQSNVLTVRVRD